MNTSKTATSLMYAACADGKVLPPYVAHNKATNLNDTWTLGGPKGAQYNRSKSGWFDLQCFSDWFMTIALPYLKKLDGKKIMIGDNLSAHLSMEVRESCEMYNIAFVFLPPNPTHIYDPSARCGIFSTDEASLERYPSKMEEREWENEAKHTQG